MIRSRLPRTGPALGPVRIPVPTGVALTAGALPPPVRALQAGGDDSLTLVEVLANIPHDTAALVVYALVAASLGLIWWGHRNASAEHHGFDRKQERKDPPRGDPWPPTGSDRPRRPAA